MPKIYEYFGILIFFYSNEHEPIHVHAKKGRNESKAEFIIVNGKIIEVRIKSIKEAPPLGNNDSNLFKEFLEVYSEQIIQKWIDYFVLHKDVNYEKITKKLK